MEFKMREKKLPQNLLITVILLFSTIALNAQNSDVSLLLGSWKSRTDWGSMTLIFHSSSELEFDGEFANYSLLPGVIRFQEDYGYIDYPYTLQGDILIISFPEGYQLQFQRIGPKSQIATSPNQPSPSKSPQTVPSLSESQNKELAASEVGDPQWGFAFKPPAGWKYQKSAQGILLGHDTIAGMIIVFPHTYSNLQAIQTGMMEGVQEEEVVMYPSGQLRQIGSSILSGEYQGMWQGQQARGRGIGTLSPHGGGAIIVAVTTSDKYGDQLSNPAQEIAQTMRYFQVDNSDLIRHFAGYWWHYSGTSAISHEKLIHFAPDGTYRDKKEDAADVSNLDQYGNVQNQYLGNFQNKGYGRWTPRGNKYEGVIIVIQPDGSSFEIEYKVKPSSPQKFGDYYFNGTLYGYITEEQLRMMNY